ncbi:MAG: hypothetical protein HY694_11385 [Deltaproteobacteria bacterium]|nr:hypothetical protein [Deltaproteobacteria bacterium]
MRKTYLFLVALSALGSVVLLLGTKWGVGLSPDSTAYISAARNLLSGKGLSVLSYSGELTPMTHYPPLFSTLLAGVGFMGVDPVEGARWLNVVLFAANISLVGLSVYAFSRSIWPALAGSFLMMSSLPIVQVHSMAWSEPLFIFFEVLGISLLALYVERPRYWILAASALAVNLGFLARYAGIALVVTGVTGILLLSKVRWKKRFADAVFFCALSSFSVTLWVFRNLAAGPTMTGREMIFHPLTAEHLQSALDIISAWLLPPTTPSRTRGISLFLVAALLGLVYLAVRRERKQDEERNLGGLTGFTPLLGFFIMSYGLTLTISISFFDAQIPIDNRIFSPAYVAALILVLCLFAVLFEAARMSLALRVAGFLFFAFFSTSLLMQTTSWLTHSYESGLGYASHAWKRSRLVKRINDLDPRVPVFTNAPDAVYLLTGRPAGMVPSRVNPGTRSLNGNYASELSEVRRGLKERDGVLVYFNSVAWRWYLPSEGELEEELALHLHAREEDGSLYQYKMVQ